MLGSMEQQNNSNLTDTGNRTPGPAARYQLNPDGRQKVYRKYWNTYPMYFVETELIF